ncbi:MAG: TIGR03088 family PEP-CTERM/XrtA system glycosyltransferase [Woeseiaceae bacterium]|nr:TIGR03088 family PEP-CTERM/XrtA system glycosyltransferase [Woeseiaceae bacterium]
MLVAHIVFRFDYGGLENGVVNVVNGLAGGDDRHVIIALTEATAFADRLSRDVQVYNLDKQPGKDPGAYLRLYRLLRRLRPDIVHTRNIGTMDCALVAFLARVPVRIHGEHGWDVHDPDGTNPRYRRMRRLLQRFVTRIVTVSDDLKQWLITTVGVPAGKILHICNGVDTGRFRPADARSQDGIPTVGSVTRFSAIKDPLNLVEAFIALRREGLQVRLHMIGDGELLARARERLREERVEDDAWLPGSRDDIPELLRDMDLFVLGSLREGISNTVLEAMSSGLPVVASDTGGNRELVESGVNGMLVPPGDRQALAAAIRDYVQRPECRQRHGSASRDRVLSRYALTTMIERYGNLYREALDLQGT